MQKIIFNKGDRVCFSEGFGIIITKNKALMIKGAGGRVGRTIEVGEIPTDAVPNNRAMDFEVSFTLRAVAAVIESLTKK